MATQEPVKKFESLLAGADFIFLIYYRGHWCPFCIAYLRAFVPIIDPIQTAGGIPVVVTSEVPKHLDGVRKATGYQGEAIVDPENILAKELKTRGLLDVAISSRWGYEHGMAQPAYLVMKRDGTVLQRWAIVPSVMNLAGGKDRPQIDQVWENVQAQLKGEKMVHETYATEGVIKVVKKAVLG